MTSGASDTPTKIGLQSLAQKNRLPIGTANNGDTKKGRPAVEPAVRWVLGLRDLGLREQRGVQAEGAWVRCIKSGMRQPNKKDDGIREIRGMEREEKGQVESTKKICPVKKGQTVGERRSGKEKGRRKGSGTSPSSSVANVTRELGRGSERKGAGLRAVLK